MKKLATSIAVMLFATFSYAQKMKEKDVPANIKSAFQKYYPAVKEVKWEKESSNYEAIFEQGKRDYSVLIDTKGNIIETEIEIELSKLPNGVLDYVKTNYSGKTIKGAAKITDVKGTENYEVETKGMDLIFDSNGKFIKEIKD